jgi:hypothetical protein
MVAGSWALDEPGSPAHALPSPGVVGAQDALTWFDSLAVVAGEGAGWEGYDAALARARTGPELIGGHTGRWRPRADLVLTGGSRGLGDHALSLWRGDTLGGIRVVAASGERGIAGGFGGGGRDLYAISAAVVRGRHMIEGAFAHRRANSSLVGGEAQEARGEGGYGRYRFEDARWDVDATFARGYDRHEGWVGDSSLGMRIADANLATIEVERGGERGSVGLRGSWRDGRVTTSPGEGRKYARAFWSALRWEGPFSDGRIEAALGLGRQGGVGRTDVAPSLAWRFTASPWEGRVVLERMLTPIWSDLAAGQSAFLQDTWVAGLEAGRRATGGGRARVSVLAGRTRDRALLARLPLESFALRSGFRADPHAYDFGLLMGEALWRSAHWALGLEGFALAHDVSSLQASVDPGRGGRAFAEGGTTFFRGDLRVRPRIEAWAIGARQSEATPSRALPGYVTFAAGLQLAMGDAVLLFEGRNLEDRARPQTWVDTATGVEALGPGRELRTTFTWRLWD